MKRGFALAWDCLRLKENITSYPKIIKISLRLLQSGGVSYAKYVQYGRNSGPLPNQRWVAMIVAPASVGLVGWPG